MQISFSGDTIVCTAAHRLNIQLDVRILLLEFNLEFIQAVYDLGFELKNLNGLHFAGSSIRASALAFLRLAAACRKRRRESQRHHE